MARLAEDHDIARTNVYAELRRIQEQRHVRLGGYRILTRAGQAEMADRPSPLLSALRAGQPIEINDWQLPRWARSERVENRRVTVHPDGRIVEVDR